MKPLSWGRSREEEKRLYPLCKDLTRSFNAALVFPFYKTDFKLLSEAMSPAAKILSYASSLFVPSLPYTLFIFLSLSCSLFPVASRFS
jgi:hypothetical protein